MPDVYESLFTTVRSDALPVDDGEERMSVAEKQQVDDIMNGLREEVKELERTAWLYESVQEQVRDNELRLSSVLTVSSFKLTATCRSACRRSSRYSETRAEVGRVVKV